jgi:methionyl-tRNA formyltransferase
VRTVYLGTSAFAVDVLAALTVSPHRPTLVVTPPDRARGRGRKVSPPPVALAARDLGLDLHQTESVNDERALEKIDKASPEAICVCQFGQIIKEPLLSRQPMLNVHPSVLPRWRGAAPIERALMAGDTVTGVTIFQVTAGLDSGPIALVRHEQIRPDDTAGTLTARLAPLGARLLVEALDSAEEGALELTEQPEDGATYADKIDPAERQLDPRCRAEELERVVRALTPGIGAYVELEGGERLGVSAARATNTALRECELAVEGEHLLLGCAHGELELLEVRPPGKRTMAAREYLRGHRVPSRVIPPGTRPSS